MKTLMIPMVFEKCTSAPQGQHLQHCPFLVTKSTRGAGRADDLFCGAMDGKKIAGYVEWESDVPPVPEWCPFVVPEEPKKPRTVKVKPPLLVGFSYAIH